MKPFLILCPLKLEMNALVAELEAKGFEFLDEQKSGLTLKKESKGSFYVAVGGHGKVQFALSTLHFLMEFPNLQGVISVGSAGALSPEVHVGHAVVSEAVVEHDHKLLYVSRPLPRFSGGKRFLEVLKDSQLDFENGNLHFGLIASGDEDVMEWERAQEIFKQTHALAVAWEGAGGARACEYKKLPFMEIRGITDIADENVVTDFSTNLKLVFPRLAQVVIALAERLG